MLGSLAEAQYKYAHDWLRFDGQFLQKSKSQSIEVIRTAVNVFKFCFVKLADRCENFVLAAISFFLLLDEQRAINQKKTQVRSSSGRAPCFSIFGSDIILLPGNLAVYAWLLTGMTGKQSRPANDAE